MATDPRLEKLREMDPVIGTFTAKVLVGSPDFVNQTYLEHAQTHMSLGDTSAYVSSLIRWAQKNKGAVIGAISGEYGYGKTSMAVHLWQQCDKEGIIAVPPFEWHRLQDIVDASWAWVRYKLEQIQPSSIEQVDEIYGRYRKKSIQEFAEEAGIAVSKVEELIRSKRVNLRCNPEDVIEFLSEMSQLLQTDHLQLFGPIVFTDELQVTMSRYQAEHRSRDEFMQDLFELLNPLINLEGSFGLIIGLPLSTEALINDVRSDILQRLQYCNLFARPNAMYKRDFPTQLWEKFAEVYEFEDIAPEILPSDTLDSIGQIAFRDDLGAGPRTVVEAMLCAIDHYDQTGLALSPIDLMDAYLGHRIAFDAGGKLIRAVTEVLQARDVTRIPEGNQVVKLMAAFPMGCPEKVFQTYNLQETKDELSRLLHTEYFHRFPEGISLRQLAATERGIEPRFIELTKSFIQTYAESDRDFQDAMKAFRRAVIEERLMTSRRADQIEGWIVDVQAVDRYIGTFDRKYPERMLTVKVSQDRNELTGDIEEIGMVFWFDPECDYETCGHLELLSLEQPCVLFRLNMLRRPSKLLTIPYIEELGYPLRRVTPVFMLALVEHLFTNQQVIPEDEKRIQLPPFIRSLVDYSIQLLFGEEILSNSAFEDLSKVGLALPKDVFFKLCQDCYPDYETLITTGRWKRAYATYLTALGSQAVSSSVGVLRGNRSLELTEKECVALFGETRKQTFYGLAENLSSVLELETGTRSSNKWNLRFKLHPAEEAFGTALRESKEHKRSGRLSLRVLGQHEGFDLLRKMGYRDEEIVTILEMSKTRRLVNLDDKKQCFVEVLESPDERRDAILVALSDLTQRAEALTKILDFDAEDFSTRMHKLTKRVTASDDIEELEECQSKLTDLRAILVQFSKKWVGKIQHDFEQTRAKTGQVLRSSLPTDLSRSLKSDVSWVGELAQCQVLLKDKYQRSHALYRDLESHVVGAWATWTSGSPNDPKALVALFDANVAAQSFYREANASLEATTGYLQSYIAWSSALNVASRAYREAFECETSYKEDRFKRDLDSIFDNIIERFKKKRLEALPDHEIFSDQIKDVQVQIDAWLRDRRDNFMKGKRFYEEKMKDFGIAKYNLHANFDSFDPDTSRINLESEVQEETQKHIDILESELKRFRTEALYAERVVCLDVSEVSTQIGKANDVLSQVKKEVQSECIRQSDCYASLTESLKQLSAEIKHIGQGIKGVLEKRPPTSEEEIVLQMLQDSRGTDLSVVIANHLAADSGSFSLDHLMQNIVALFKKNQVIIRLEKRR